MVTFLNLLLICLMFVLVVSVILIFIIAVDYICYEIQQMRLRDRRWAHTARHMIHEAGEATANVTKLINDSIAELAKAKLREKKEAEARQSFFEDGYFKGFDETGELIYRGATAPSDPDWDFFTEIDKIADAQIFENTKDM